MSSSREAPIARFGELTVTSSHVRWTGRRGGAVSVLLDDVTAVGVRRFHSPRLLAWAAFGLLEALVNEAVPLAMNAGLALAIVCAVTYFVTSSMDAFVTAGATILRTSLRKTTDDATSFVAAVEQARFTCRRAPSER